MSKVEMLLMKLSSESVITRKHPCQNNMPTRYMQ